MASITTKKRKSGIAYYICYRVPDENGIPKQVWLPCKDKREAEALLPEVLQSEKAGLIFEKTPASVYMQSSSQANQNMTVSELIAIYNERTAARKKWKAGTIDSHDSLTRNYITPFIGSIKVAQLTPMVIQNYYDDLPNHKAVGKYLSKREPKNISDRTVLDIHKVLHPALDLAVTWQLLLYNPSQTVKKPIIEKKIRPRWNEAELLEAMSKVESELDYLCMALMFACTLRSGELAGLTWDCVNVSEDTIQAGTSSILINKTLKREGKEALEKTEKYGDFTYFRFPPILNAKKTVVVLKIPKTQNSSRRVFLPASVARLLLEHKRIQDNEKEFLGSAYNDYNIVTAQWNGNPYKTDTFAKHFKGFIASNEFRNVDFYSLRHSSITEKLRRNPNVKSVQGDAGDATASVIQDVYAGIVDEDRMYNAELMQAAFFDKVNRESENNRQHTENGVDFMDKQDAVSGNVSESG